MKEPIKSWNEMIEQALLRAPEISRLVLEWSKTNYREFPWRKEMTPYRILVAEILLKRTTASAVNRIFYSFIERYPTIEYLANADSQELEELLRTIGYHKQRTRIFIEVSHYIINNFGGKIPEDINNLLSIPHIGCYTAGAIRSLGFNIPAAMVDSNVLRIYKRVFQDFLPEKAIDRRIREIADLIIPKNDHKEFNFALLDLSAKICSYQKTECNLCPLTTICDHSKHRKKE